MKQVDALRRLDDLVIGLGGLVDVVALLHFSKLLDAYAARCRLLVALGLLFLHHLVEFDDDQVRPDQLLYPFERLLLLPSPVHSLIMPTIALLFPTLLIIRLIELDLH